MVDYLAIVRQLSGWFADESNCQMEVIDRCEEFRRQESYALAESCNTGITTLTYWADV